MISTATTLREHLPVSEEFSNWETTFYIRHTLRNVPFHDVSLVDRFIEVAGHSFRYAARICAFVHSSLGLTPRNDLDTRSTISPIRINPLYVIEQIVHHTLSSLDPGIMAQLTKDSEFDMVMRAENNWRQFCEMHRLIAHVCFRTMNDSLQFNMCSIPCSYLPNDDPQIEQLIQNAQAEKRINPTLIYACSQWAYHAFFVLPDFMALVRDFLQNHALHWIETLSLAGKDASYSLHLLSESSVSGFDRRLRQLTDSLCCFLDS